MCECGQDHPGAYVYQYFWVFCIRVYDISGFFVEDIRVRIKIFLGFLAEIRRKYYLEKKYGKKTEPAIFIAHGPVIVRFD